MPHDPPLPGDTMLLLMQRISLLRDLLAAAHNISHNLSSTLPQGEVVFRGDSRDVDWLKDSLSRIDPGHDLSTALDKVFGDGEPTRLGANVIPLHLPKD